MRICPKCGYVYKEDGVFCTQCGFRYRTSANDPVSESINFSGYADDGNPAPAKHGKKGNNHLNFGTEKEKDKDQDTPLTPHWESVSSKKKTGRRKKPAGPMIAGILAILVIAGIAIFSFVRTWEKANTEKKQIDTLHTEIMATCKREREDYLEESVKIKDIEEFEERANTIKNSENSQNLEKINRLRDLKEKQTEYDDKLVEGQTKELNKARKKVIKNQDKAHLKEFMIAGEDEEMQGYDADYSTHLEEKKFRLCSDDLDHMKSLSEKILDDSESQSMYSEGSFPLNNEFIPQTIEVSVDAETYTENLTDDHFTLIEKIGGEDPQYLKASIKKRIQEGNEVRYQLYFKTNNNSDYTTQRGYRLHVRNLEGTKGFNMETGTRPADYVKLAVKDKLEEFVELYNRDCQDHQYYSLKDMVESDSQAEDRLSGIPGSREKEAIIDSDDDYDTFHINQDGTVFAKIRLTHEVLEVKSYGELEPEEESRMRSDMQKDDRIQQYQGQEYVIGENSSDQYVAEPVNEADYYVGEKYSGLESFTFRMSNNAINALIRYEVEEREIIEVEGVEYKPDPDNYIILNNLIY